MTNYLGFLCQYSLLLVTVSFSNTVSFLASYPICNLEFYSKLNNSPIRTHTGPFLLTEM